VDNLISADGTAITGYKADAYTLDNVLMGRNLLMLYNVTGIKNTIQRLLRCTISLKNNPVLQKVVFGIKKYTKSKCGSMACIWPNHFMRVRCPVHHEADFDDIAKQFILMEQHARDPKTGCNTMAGITAKNKMGERANRFIAKLLGPCRWLVTPWLWLMCSTICPQDYTKRADIIAILNRLATAIQKYQDPKSGVWYDIFR